MSFYIQRLRRWLSEKLCPSAHRSAERYARLRGQLNDYEHWLGTTHPEAAAVCYHLLKEDLNYWNGKQYDDRPSHWWRSPKWVWRVDGFRAWLDTKPFEGRT